MGGNCSKDQDGAVFSATNDAGAPTRPLVALGMGSLQPVNLKSQIVIPTCSKPCLALQCASRSDPNTSSLVHFELTPPFTDGERRTVVSQHAELCVEITASSGVATAPSGRKGMAVLLCATVCSAAGLYASDAAPLSIPWLLNIVTALLFAAAWFLGTGSDTSSGSAGAPASFSARLIGVNGKGLQLEQTPVVVPVSETGLWTVAEGKAGRFQGLIQSKLANVREMLLAKDGELGWHRDKIDRGLEYYTREGTKDGMIQFKGQMDIQASATDVLFCFLDSGQRKIYDEDFDPAQFRIVETVDRTCMLCNVTFSTPGPFLASRVFVTINYVARDPETGQLLYYMFSVEDPAEIATAKPNPKSVLGEVQAAYLITPLGDGGCTVVMWSVANPKLTGGSLIANTLSKMKPLQLGKVSKMLAASDPMASKRIAAARNNFADCWCS